MFWAWASPAPQIPHFYRQGPWPTRPSKPSLLSTGPAQGHDENSEG